MSFWDDISAGKIWDDVLGVFNPVSEAEAAEQIARDVREAEAAARQEAAPVGDGGRLTLPAGVPDWAVWAAGGLLAFLVARALLK